MLKMEFHQVIGVLLALFSILEENQMAGNTSNPIHAPISSPTCKRTSIPTLISSPSSFDPIELFLPPSSPVLSDSEQVHFLPSSRAMNDLIDLLPDILDNMQQGIILPLDSDLFSSFLRALICYWFNLESLAGYSDYIKVISEKYISNSSCVKDVNRVGHAVTLELLRTPLRLKKTVKSMSNIDIDNIKKTVEHLLSFFTFSNHIKRQLVMFDLNKPRVLRKCACGDSNNDITMALLPISKLTSTEQATCIYLV